MIGEFVNFNMIGSFDETYCYMVALITFFTMLKFLKLLRFNKRIGMLSKSLRHAGKDLNSFGFVFLVFILAYAQMGFAIFGGSLDAYKTFFTSLTTCFRMLLGEIKAPSLVAASRVYGKTILYPKRANNKSSFFIFLGTIYFFSFVILVFIALLSIFVTM